MSVVELARSERVSHPTMSRIVAGLNRAGAVSRTAKPSDRRSRTVELTDRGRELYEKICANRTALTAAILDQLSPTAAAEVLAAVERVARAVEEKRPLLDCSDDYVA